MTVYWSTQGAAPDPTLVHVTHSQQSRHLLLVRLLFWLEVWRRVCVDGTATSGSVASTRCAQLHIPDGAMCNRLVCRM